MFWWKSWAEQDSLRALNSISQTFQNHSWKKARNHQKSRGFTPLQTSIRALRDYYGEQGTIVSGTWKKSTGINQLRPCEVGVFGPRFGDLFVMISGFFTVNIPALVFYTKEVRAFNQVCRPFTHYQSIIYDQYTKIGCLHLGIVSIPLLNPLSTCTTENFENENSEHFIIIYIKILIE